MLFHASALGPIVLYFQNDFPATLTFSLSLTDYYLSFKIYFCYFLENELSELPHLGYMPNTLSSPTTQCTPESQPQSHTAVLQYWLTCVYLFPLYHGLSESWLSTFVFINLFISKASSNTWHIKRDDNKKKLRF